MASTGTTINPYRYNGKLGYQYNEETDDYYVRARTYEPTIARWMSQDPLGFVDGLGLYKYVSNNPLSLVDPSGTLLIKPQGGQKLGFIPCGGKAYLRWAFYLQEVENAITKNGGTLKSGFLVQRVDVVCRVRNCDANKPNLERKFRYYEAWPVLKGDRTPWFTKSGQLATVGHSDEASWELPPFDEENGDNGEVLQRGIVKFFTDDTVKETILKWHTPIPNQPESRTWYPKKGHRCQTTPGYLRSTDNEKLAEFFYQPALVVDPGPTQLPNKETYSRSFSVDWDCCSPCDCDRPVGGYADGRPRGGFRETDRRNCPPPTYIEDFDDDWINK